MLAPWCSDVPSRKRNLTSGNAKRRRLPRNLASLLLHPQSHYQPTELCRFTFQHFIRLLFTDDLIFSFVVATIDRLSRASFLVTSTCTTILAFFPLSLVSHANPDVFELSTIAPATVTSLRLPTGPESLYRRFYRPLVLHLNSLSLAKPPPFYGRSRAQQPTRALTGVPFAIETHDHTSHDTLQYRQAVFPNSSFEHCCFLRRRQ